MRQPAVHVHKKGQLWVGIRRRGTTMTTVINWLAVLGKRGILCPAKEAAKIIFQLCQINKSAPNQPTALLNIIH